MASYLHSPAKQRAMVRTYLKWVRIIGASEHARMAGESALSMTRRKYPGINRHTLYGYVQLWSDEFATDCAWKPRAQLGASSHRVHTRG